MHAANQRDAFARSRALRDYYRHMPVLPCGRLHALKIEEMLVAGQKSGVVYALYPDDNGKLLWQVRVGKGGTNGGVQWGMASDGRNLYASVSDVVRLPPPPGAAGDASHPVGPVGNAFLASDQGGGVTALGAKKAYPVVVDETVQLFERIAISAGVRVKMLPSWS